MGISTSLRAVRLFILFIFMPIAASAQAQDIWVYQNPGDAYYFDDNETAAIVQSDQTFAILSLRNSGAIIDVHIGFFGKELASSLKSTLIDADGTTHSLVVEGAFLIGDSFNKNGFLLYTFSLNDSDISKFQHASTWRIETPMQTVNYSLKGTRVALDQVVAAQNGSQ